MSPKRVPVIIGGPETPKQSKSPQSALHTVLMLRRADRALDRRLAASLKPLKLNITQWLVLSFVANTDSGCSARQLANELGLAAPQISLTTNSLQQQLLIKSHPLRDDYRGKNFSATAKGRTIAEDATAAVQQAVAKWLRTIPENYLAIYYKVIQQLTD